MATQGLAWKALEGDTQVAIPSGDIKWAEWIRVARNFQLRIGLTISKKSGKDSEPNRETFDGFQREDQEKIAKLLKQFYGVNLETKDTTFKGWNWGATDFRGLNFVCLFCTRSCLEYRSRPRLPGIEQNGFRNSAINCNQLKYCWENGGFPRICQSSDRQWYRQKIC
jgi:POB3-like N-terminal PH domain